METTYTKEDKGITVMLDVRLDPGDTVREELEGALRGYPGVHSADFSPYVRRILKVRYDADAIKATDIGRFLHEALGAHESNTYIVGL